MEQYIPKSVLVTRIERLMEHYNESAKEFGDGGYGDNVLMEQCKANTCKHILSFIDTLEAKEVDLEKEAELIANGIMISVQANKYSTNIYNTERNDFNHHHLQMAARKGIELGLKTQNRK